MHSQELLSRYTAACNYPCLLDVEAVEESLRRYLAALGITRKVVRLEVGWELSSNPSLLRYIASVLAEFYTRSSRNAITALNASAALDASAALNAIAASDARNALAALNARNASAASDAIDARNALTALALRRFTTWCILSYNWWCRFELSWLATTYLGASQLNKTTCVKWSEPLFEAFVSGAWLLHFTGDTLFWVAQPSVHTEHVEGSGRGRRLHNENGPALRSDIENIYFWHGVMVPAFVVTNPEWITVNHIETESNAEVRRVMIERYGQTRYLLDSGAELVHQDDWGKLYEKTIADDEPIVMVKVVNSTPEADGSYKDYFIRCHPELCPLLADGSFGKPQQRTARNAVASTFGMTGAEYLMTKET